MLPGGKTFERDISPFLFDVARKFPAVPSTVATHSGKAMLGRATFAQLPRVNL